MPKKRSRSRNQQKLLNENLNQTVSHNREGNLNKAYESDNNNNELSSNQEKNKNSRAGRRRANQNQPADQGYLLLFSI